MIVRNRINLWSWSWVVANKKFWPKGCNFLWSWSWNTLEFMINVFYDHDHAYQDKSAKNPYNYPKTFHFILNPLKTHSSSPPPSPILKKNLLLIFSFKILHKILKIGLITSESNHGIRIFIVKPIQRKWWIVKPKRILEYLLFPPP